MFLIGVAGPHLSISGAVSTENFVSQRLTDYIYLGPLPTCGGESALSHSAHRVAQLLRALKISTQELTDYYKSLQFVTPITSKLRGSAWHGGPRPSPVPLHPITSAIVPPHFQEYTVDDKTYKIHYTERLSKCLPFKAIFKGTIECEEDKARRDVVIKFTYAYCKAAHELLITISRAPNLWFCDYVHCVGMYVVVMDYVSGEHGGTPLEDQAHVDQLREALATLHDEDYVYGDLRSPNILIATDGLKLIDFDWCGKEGTVRYPADTCLDRNMKWHSGVRLGGLITKAHDIHMFNHLARSSSSDSTAEEHGPPAT